jgi:ABC-type branched-subunit amino acid transport system substrate-binding protein
MRIRVGVALASALALLVAGCGGGEDVESQPPSDGGTTTPANTTPSYCEGANLTAADIGVTPEKITVTVMADVGSEIRPALFKGSWEGMKAWAEKVNASGGLACRQVEVKEADSKLSPDDSKNGIATACTNSLAMVGTTALFLNDVSGLASCKDKAGATTGLPDIAVLQTESAQQCSEFSYATLPTGSSCPYSGTGERTFKVGYTQYDYYLNRLAELGVPEDEGLHGVFVVPKDLPSTIAASMPIFRAENEMGIKSDAEFGKSGLDLQTAYTPVVQAIKQNNSTYARNGLDYSGTLLMRKEAKAQGVDSVKVWDCSVQCYDERLITEAQGATEGQYVWLNILPMEDGAEANPELANFLKYNEAPDGFGLQAYVSGLIFERAIADAIAANGNDPNAITRANVLDAVRNIHDFDGNGMVPPLDIGNKVGSVCLVGMQIQGDKFVRVNPPEPGTFDCGGNKPPLELTLDPQEEYQG